MAARPRARRAGRAGRRATAATLTAGLLLAACGGAPYGTEDDPIPAQEAGPRGNAYATVKTWLTACAEEEGEVVADILTTPVREALYAEPNVLAGCERVADLVPGPVPPLEELKRVFEEATIEDVRVDGGFGTATVRTPLGTVSEFELERSMGAWALSNPPLFPR